LWPARTSVPRGVRVGPVRLTGPVRPSSVRTPNSARAVCVLAPRAAWYAWPMERWGSVFFALLLAACGGKAVVDGSAVASGGNGGPGGSGGTGGALAGECPGGFCRDAVMSSCGDDGYVPSFDPGSCTTFGGQTGYCCFPSAPTAGMGPCPVVGGYCTSTSMCQPGYGLTQMGCEINGGPGSCCVPG
jgi:hypothetical protein